MGSRHMESAQAFAQQYGIPRCYDSYEGLALTRLMYDTRMSWGMKFAGEV